jgi:hypothetical protein
MMIGIRVVIHQKFNVKIVAIHMKFMFYILKLSKIGENLNDALIVP